jgi:hypothetical protein
VAVSEGGTIEGKAVFKGAVPMRKIIPTKDKDVCGGIRDEPQVVVGPDKGVQGAFVYLQKVAKGKAWAETPQPYELNNLKCQFAPHVQVIPMRSELEIINSDPTLHNTHGFLGRRTVFNVALPDQDMRVKASLKRPGIVRVECDAHGWMLGWIYVADNPYYAVTAEDGTFTITDVPPGTYTLVAWQEYTGSMEIPVTVKAKEVAQVPIELKKGKK